LAALAAAACIATPREFLIWLEFKMPRMLLTLWLEQHSEEFITSGDTLAVGLAAFGMSAVYFGPWKLWPDFFIGLANMGLLFFALSSLL
jgi:hypothetical protein